MRRTLGTLALVLAGCASGGEPVVGAEVAFDPDVVTVVHVLAETAEPATVRVEWGLDTAYGATSPETPTGTDHDVVLLGLRAETTYHWRTVARVDGEDVYGPDDTFTTGELPDGVPDFLLLDEADADTYGKWTLLTGQALASETGFVVVLDDEAQVVWYRVHDGLLSWAEHEGGGDVLYLIPGTEGKLVRTSLDGARRAEYPAPEGHHAGTRVPGAVGAYLATDLRAWEGEDVLGDQIVEIAEDGTRRVVWTAWDTLEVEHHEGWDSEEAGADWTHANGLAYDPTDDAYYVTLYYLGTALKISRATGEVLWQLGGPFSDFTFPEGEGPGRLHSPEPLADGRIAVFDNSVEGGSAVSVYRIDEVAGTADREELWRLEDGRVVTVLGDVDRLPDGGWFTTWGNMRQMAVVGAEGQVSWRAESTDVDCVLGMGERMESLYP